MERSQVGNIPQNATEGAKKWVSEMSVDRVSNELRAVNQSLDAIASGSPKSSSTKEDLEARKRVLEEYIQTHRVRV